MYFSLETIIELQFDSLLPLLQVAMSLSTYYKEQESACDVLVPSPHADHDRREAMVL